MLKKFLFVLLVGPSLSACVYGPKLKNKTSYLNGKNYAFTGITVAKTRVPVTRISGKVNYSLNSDNTKQYKIVLKNSNKTKIDEYTLDRNGLFSFSSIMPNGNYYLEVISDNKNIKNQLLKINSYKIENIKIFL